jgi:AcrR family transcriptional regulator
MLSKSFKEAGMPKSNRKTRYTNMVLRDSLIELMKEESILRISIKDICDLADVSRSTFYAHYKDQYDLLRQIQEEVFAYFTDMVNQYDVSMKRGSRESESIIQRMLRYIADNSNSLRILLSENGDIDFQKKFFQHFIVKARNILHDTSENPEETYIYEGYSVFVVHGAIGLMRYWLKNDMHIPIPTLTKMLIKLTQPARNYT